MGFTRICLILALTLVKPAASGFYPHTKPFKNHETQILENLKAKVMTKSKKRPTLAITHNPIGPYNKVFQ
jgi:hypothetical protein